MAGGGGGGEKNHKNNKNHPPHPPGKDLTALEAAAVNKAKATADANFRPSNTLLNDTELLLAAVDGPDLRTYMCDESVYLGTAIPIAAGSQLQLPITIAIPGSVIEYVVQLTSHDINFSIIAEREEGITSVKDPFRLAAEDSPVTQKFLVGTTPCMLRFEFDNTFSWLREKHITYKITVTPPSRESLLEGRRRRAVACVKAIGEDLVAAESRYKATVQDGRKLTAQIQALEKQLQEAQLALAVGIREETLLKERRELRLHQQQLLQQRLDNGWEDETTTGSTNSSSHTNPQQNGK